MDTSEKASAIVLLNECGMPAKLSSKNSCCVYASRLLLLLASIMEGHFFLSFCSRSWLLYRLITAPTTESKRLLL